MGLVTSEANHMRKSHRVNLPITVQIADVSYECKDWSMTGIGLDGYTEKLETDQIVESKVILPMVDSVLALNVKLKFKRGYATHSGFEFTDLSPQVRRVLRQYIELAVEGKLDNLEDMAGVLTTPALDTPLENALTLSDVEQDAMARHFASGSRVAITAGVLFLCLLLGTLFYSTIYRVSGTGLVGGTLLRVRAPAAGTISHLVVTQDAVVKKNAPLFSIMSNTQENKINEIRAKIAQIIRQKNDVGHEVQIPSGSLAKELAAAVRMRQGEYQQAKKLYAQRILSIKDFHYVADQLSNARIAYTRNAKNEQIRLGTSTEDRLKKIKALDLDLVSANTQLTYLTNHSANVHAINDGHIFHIDALEGTYVNAGDVVMVMETDVVPDILMKLEKYDAIKVHVGMPATIVLPFNGKKLQATISAIGYNAVYGQSTPTQDVSLNETLIKLELVDHSIRLPANAHVKVWIKTFKWPWA